MAFRVLHARDAEWLPSGVMAIPNSDLGRQLETEVLGARLWRLQPGQASTRHRHVDQHELYVLLEGTGRARVEDELLTLEPLSAFVVEPRTIRQIFNDTDRDALWLVCGAPPDPYKTVAELYEEMKADLLPDGPRALPPELKGTDDG
jgi:quercetin dioxygenase-like cupin family protein